MKIVNIDGGLGNQMFKYAFALVLREKHPNEIVYIDSRLCRYRRPQAHNGYELDKLFNLEIKEATLWQILKISKRAFGSVIYKISHRWYEKYKSYFYEHIDNSYIEDYLAPSVYNKDLVDNSAFFYFDISAQSWQYYEDYKDLIKKAFVFKIPLDNYNNKIISEMKNCNSVAIHFRMGDYLLLPYFNVCSIEYYNQAINIVKEKLPNIHYYIFTNDTDSFNNNLSNELSIEGEAITIIDKNTVGNNYKDIILMSQCKCVIIANSSFSWWGAWLNEIPNHILISPKRWFLNDECPDICPNDWIRI